MLDDRVRSVLARLDEEDEREHDRPIAERSLSVGPQTGRLLFALVAGRRDCRVLEIGASRGYSTIWLAAGARIHGGRVVSLEVDPARAEVWRRNISDAGLEACADLVEGDALERLAGMEDRFDVVLLDAWKDDYEQLFQLARARLGPGGVLVADNVVTHADDLADYIAARKADPDAVSVTAPVGWGLEITTILR